MQSSAASVSVLGTLYCKVGAADSSANKFAVAPLAHLVHSRPSCDTAHEKARREGGLSACMCEIF